MTNVDMETIDLACLGLKNAVQKYCKKRKRDPPPTDSLEHACHILRQLSTKRTCLHQGLTAFESCYSQWLQTITEETMTSVLTHLFHQYLRLRDGLNLMTSGECRHVGDVKQAQQSKFKSRLNKQSLRGDGYTTLYSAKYYSGYAWDEFFDPNVGVLHRLQAHVKWDWLLDHGAQAFESCLDQHETALQEIQSKLESLRLLIIKDLSRHGKVEFLTRDKMERLSVTTKKTGRCISLERRGKDFQLKDKYGCLPNGWKVQDWKRAMEYVASPPTKKQKEESNANAKPTVVTVTKKQAPSKRRDAKPMVVTTENGLKLQIQDKIEKEGEEEEENLEVSLNDVKEEFDVNAEDLEKSREVLEAEDANGGNKMSMRTNLDGEMDEKELIQQDVEEAKEKVQRFKRVLARVEKRVDEFDHELWDARECLREACMTLGSHLLSWCAVDCDMNASGRNLAEARNCFREARVLVKKQESVHQVNGKQTNDFSEDARSIQRKLLLLRGRAHVNLAIALVELSLLNSPEPVRKDLEKEAITELESARSCASAIRARATVDETKGASKTEIAIDRLDADQLDALTNRWFGKTFWYQRRYKEAVVAFENGSTFFIDRKRSSASDRDMREAELELGVECFFASTSLADLALDALEKHQVVIQGHPKREECLVRGQELFSVAIYAYKTASLISAGLENLKSGSSSFEDTLNDNGIVSPKEIENIMEQISSWWNEKKQGVVLRPMEDGKLGNERNALRNDLFSSAVSRLHNQSTTPVKRFTINENSSRRSSQRRKQAGGSGLSGANGTRARVNGGSRTSSSNPKARPAKWGDDFLPQKTLPSGETVPILPYPCVAPPLPPGFKPFYQPKK